MKPVALLTGWLQKNSWDSTIPRTMARVVNFDVMTNGSDGEAVPWRCEIHDPALAMRVEPKLIAGAAVIIHARLDGRPFKKHGVHEGWSRFLVVEELEFSRVTAKAEVIEPAEV